MGLFYKASRKELLELRNKIFLERGAAALYQQGFVKSPFPSDWFGRNNLKDFSYVLCRLTPKSNLERITVHISRGDRWIKIFLNIFELTPQIDSLQPLTGLDGMQYHLPPNSISSMRLRSGDIKGPPILHMRYWNGHKLKRYFTKHSLNSKAEKLARTVENDMLGIDSFIKRWHEIYPPNLTDWVGNRVGQNLPNP